ncbi:MAG: TVP38/TMEM64 family protein [Ignavibacteriales bacterium]
MEFTTVNSAVDYLRSFGVWMPLVTFMIFFVQAMFPVFPSFVLAGAAGLIFGFWEGFFMAWLGSLAGACCEFYLIRLARWDRLRAFILSRYKIDVKKVKPSLGFWTIVLARIFPVVPTPVINVVSGISGVSFGIFLAASAVGKLPTALAFSGVGVHFYYSHNIVESLLLLLAVFVFGAVGVRVIQKRRRIQDEFGEETPPDNQL